MEQTNPYPECEKCKTLGDCPYRVVLDDGMGSVMPPSDCNRFTDVLRETVKERKRKRTRTNNG
jgi:hypothetical protein